MNQFLLVKYTNTTVKVLRFPDDYTSDDFISYVRDNEDIQYITTPKLIKPTVVYK